MGQVTLECLARFCQGPKPGNWSHGHPASYTLCSYVTSYSKQQGVGKDRDLAATVQRRGQGVGRPKGGLGPVLAVQTPRGRPGYMAPGPHKAFLHSQQRLWGAGLGAGH